MLARKVRPLVWSLFPMAVSSPHARRMAPRFCMDLPPSGSLSLSVASERVLIARRPSERGADHNEHRHRHGIRTVRKAVKLRVGQSLHECGGWRRGDRELRQQRPETTQLSAHAASERKLGDGGYSAVGPDRGARRRPGAGGIDPDAVYAQPLRRGDLPLQVVAHAPGVGGAGAEGGHRFQVYLGLGLAKAELAFYQDVVEVWCKMEALDLCPHGSRSRRW